MACARLGTSVAQSRLRTVLRDGHGHSLRLLSTRSVPPLPPSIVYRRVRRGHSLLMSALAATQASFWGYTAYLTHHAADPLLAPGWTAAGLGLSAAFAGMVHVYLKRNVAEISIVHGSTERVRVVTHSLGGTTSAPVLLDPANIVAGPHKDDSAERYWTFAHDRAGVRTRLFYIVDTSKGVKDRTALAAIARGGEHFLALAHKRRAAEMRDRWRAWEESEFESEDTEEEEAAPNTKNTKNTR